MSVWGSLRAEKAESWFFSPVPLTNSRAGTTDFIQPEVHYISAALTSMRIGRVRIASRRLYGAVASSITMPSRAGGNVEFVMLTTPSVLRDIDPHNLDRVVLSNKRLLGPVPYRGGDVGVDIGLFSIPSADLVEPYLDLVEKFATVAGVSLVDVAKPFVEPIKSALDMLMGVPDGPQLEIGVSTTFSEPQSGFYCVIRAPRDRIDQKQLAVASDGRLVGPDGSEISAPHLLFRLTATRRRDDWASIPELQRRYSELRNAAERGDLPLAEHMVAIFSRAAAFSNDLLKTDGERLGQLVQDLVDQAFSNVPTAATSVGHMPELSAVRLYDGA